MQSATILAITFMIPIAILACNVKSIESLNCQSLVEQTMKLAEEKSNPITEITNVQELTRTESKLECKGSTKDADGEIAPIKLYEEDTNEGRIYGYENLPIAGWECDDLVPISIQSTKSPGFYFYVIDNIYEVKLLSSNSSKLLCSGAAVTDSGKRINVEFFVESYPGDKDQWVTSFKTPGEVIEYRDNTLYYALPVTKQQAQRLFDWLREQEMFSDESGIDVQLRMETGYYEFRMPMKAGLDVDSLASEMELFACELTQEVFDGTQVDVILVNQHFDEIIRRTLCND